MVINDLMGGRGKRREKEREREREERKRCMHAYSQCVSHNLLSTSLSSSLFSCVCDQREREKKQEREREEKERKKSRTRKCPCSSSFVREKEVIGTVFHHSAFPLIGPKGHSPIRHMDTQHTHFLPHSFFLLFPFFYLASFSSPSSFFLVFFHRPPHSITFVQMCELCVSVCSLRSYGPGTVT